MREEAGAGIGCHVEWSGGPEGWTKRKEARLLALLCGGEIHKIMTTHTMHACSLLAAAAAAATASPPPYRGRKREREGGREGDRRNRRIERRGTQYEEGGMSLNFMPSGQ